MTLRLALRSLAVQPVRSIVLACGFGTGIAAMAGLLGVGEVILEQSRAPVLEGGGDLVIEGISGDVHNARFVLSHVLSAPPLAERVETASPAILERLYLIDNGPALPVYARAGVPQLERRLGDPEVSDAAAWQDNADDRSWAAPDPARLLRDMDRFHRIPEGSEFGDSWAEWLYFNGQSGDTRFYLTFLVGPPTENGRQRAGVRLQLDRPDGPSTYSVSSEVDIEDVLEGAPDLTIGDSSVVLDGLTYRIVLSLPADDGGAPLIGRLSLTAEPGRAMPPFQIRGARGWLTGYVVPVLAGTLDGKLRAGGQPIEFSEGKGYHDHNWGYWEGVTWRWGQVVGDEISVVWGRIFPPPSVADPARLPGLMAVLGPEGPLGFATDVQIEEIGSTDPSAPARLLVRSAGALDLTLDLSIRDIVRTRLPGAGLMGQGRPTDFLQLRGEYEVTGRVAGHELRFQAPGAAETFRGADFSP